MPDNDMLIGEIHAGVKAIHKRMDEHLADYKDHKDVTVKSIQKLEKRQIAVAAWVAGSFGSGAGVVALISRITM